MENVTPMMRQYLQIKEQYPDAILFFRLGDFYEMFFEDALVASKILEIALTGKSYGAPERAPMCGVPYHSAESYLQKLVAAGKRVAICEQIEDPKDAKGIVQRSVVRIVSPGTNVTSQSLEGYEDSYLMGIYLGDRVQVAYADVSTGEINAAVLRLEDVRDFVVRVRPMELLLYESQLGEMQKHKELDIFLRDLAESVTITRVQEHSDGIAAPILQLSAELQKRYGAALDLVMGYIMRTQGTISSNIQTLRVYEEASELRMDPASKRNLELTENFTTKQKKHSLFDFLDESKTSLGKRTLRKWIEHPLIDERAITKRLDIIEELNQSFALREDLRELLDEIYDLERITGKMSYSALSSRDVVALRSSIKVLPSLFSLIQESGLTHLYSLTEQADALEDIHRFLQETIEEEPSLTLKDGSIIRSSYHSELARYRALEGNTAEVLSALEQQERIKTGIKGLKVGYNKVFGYYIEITHAAGRDAEIPPHYIRKQTLANAERYINEELKELESQILGARQKAYEIQAELYDAVRSYLLDQIQRINQTAELIGKLDALLSLSVASIRHKMVRPSFQTGHDITIRAARHPVIEEILGEERFVPNDLTVDESSKVQIITGPNMGGKSTFMRQTALIVILAQMGSYVPAEYASLPIFDAIYTRIGASDDLSLGESTFMVEMKEVSYILKHATPRSLVILDEVGRGTSTFDGMSIAWAIIEHIARHVGCTTLFSTHYHEITDLEESHRNIKNFYIAVEEREGEIHFLHKILPGRMDKSYGIHVAKIAGLPHQVLFHANQKLSELEQEGEGAVPRAAGAKRQQEVAPRVQQLSFEDYQSSEIKQRLTALELDDISPRRAHQILEELQLLAQEGNL